LTTIIDRGKRGINFILTSMVFNIFPIIFEVLIVSTLLYYNFGIEYVVIGLSSIAVYTMFTIIYTNYRTKHRKMMNKTENLASTRVKNYFY
jgi:ATP-binding cassette subfamily B (MDR/TAP) protein 7